MPEDQPAPSKGFTRDLLTEAKNQAKKLLVAKILVLGSAAVTALWALLRGATELEQGIVWGAIALLALQVIALLAYSAWTLRQSKRTLILARKRKANPTAAEREAHIRSIADQAALLSTTADRLIQHIQKSMAQLEKECASRGVNFAALPEEIQNKMVSDLFTGPFED